MRGLEERMREAGGFVVNLCVISSCLLVFSSAIACHIESRDTPATRVPEPRRLGAGC